MLEKIWRYSVNIGDHGGIVLADTEEEAEKKVREKYGENNDIVVWLITNDDYFDNDNPDVLECYGW